MAPPNAVDLAVLSPSYPVSSTPRSNLAVFVDPNAAQTAHAYADTISDRLKKELNQAVQTGVLVKVDGWDINLPPPADVTAKINAVPPLKLPPLPEISRDATAKE